jgi:hypothetical protein
VLAVGDRLHPIDWRLAIDTPKILFLYAALPSPRGKMPLSPLVTRRHGLSASLVALQGASVCAGFDAKVDRAWSNG